MTTILAFIVATTLDNYPPAYFDYAMDAPPHAHYVVKCGGMNVKPGQPVAVFYQSEVTVTLTYLCGPNEVKKTFILKGLMPGYIRHFQMKLECAPPDNFPT